MFRKVREAYVVSVETPEYQRLLKRISKNIRAARESKGWTQEEMTRFGFNYRHYQKLESGTYSFNLFTLFRLSKAFALKVEDLLKSEPRAK